MEAFLWLFAISIKTVCADVLQIQMPTTAICHRHPETNLAKMERLVSEEFARVMMIYLSPTMQSQRITNFVSQCWGLIWIDWSTIAHFTQDIRIVQGEQNDEGGWHFKIETFSRSNWIYRIHRLRFMAWKGGQTPGEESIENGGYEIVPGCQIMLTKFFVTKCTLDFQKAIIMKNIHTSSR